MSLTLFILCLRVMGGSGGVRGLKMEERRRNVCIHLQFVAIFNLTCLIENENTGSLQGT